MGEQDGTDTIDTTSAMGPWHWSRLEILGLTVATLGGGALMALSHVLLRAAA